MASSFMEEAQYAEANNILVAMQDHYSMIGGDIEIIMVFGGGVSPLSLIYIKKQRSLPMQSIAY
ncbi:MULTISPECIES: hypothetical protein [Paenibacillus]|uniref:hypothetical protein n=1 Tax=Paenibacillus TaxID=44249 RepID=UPI000D2F720E|nr:MULTISPECIES: hypothetical protein [Paenibacillus]KAF6614304.1 hypothetical protein HFE00_25550 [Paenibacillus sp. EKM101P]KAF6616662.1 hypothetical protein HFE03_25390 [Paenibacillus sp. EKM102P]KAF6625116.1 hypothetical protein HFE01_25690 [Paenibacillus sp. EKM10P]KAF6640969.1 hypothetical protein HFE02_25660 [Paenibacillus sp. EKM11P]PTU44254.1 hypothetical protein DBL67_24275 [Paenibacillus polymyxa]